MKRILVISLCSVRSSGRGLTSDFLHSLDLGNNEVTIDLFDISIMANHDRNDYSCSNYFSMPISTTTRILSKSRLARLFWNEYIICKEYKRILQKEVYDLVILFQIPRFSDRLVNIANSKNVKIGLYPWGSDILRCRYVDSIRIKNAFKKCDFILGYKGSVTMRTAISKYKAIPQKVKAFSLVVSGVETIQKNKNRYTRNEMHGILGIPYSSYNIVCGYNADPGQQHISSIESIFKVKELLPRDYQIIFPVSYGDRNGYIDSLKTICNEKCLNSVFLEEYITDEQMAFLHLITDLYINNQKTDNGNAFLIEALSCGNCIVSGSWLKYTQFEDYGKPYYQFETKEDLSEIVKVILSENRRSVIVPEALMKDLQSRTITKLKDEWGQFFSEL